MLPAVQHYAAVLSEPPSRALTERASANIVPNSGVYSPSSNFAGSRSNHLNDERFEILSPVLAPSAVSSEAVLSSKTSFSPKYSHDVAQTRYLRTSSLPEAGSEFQSKSLSVYA